MVKVKLEHISDVTEQKPGYILVRSPVYHRADTDSQTTIHTHIHTYVQLRISC